MLDRAVGWVDEDALVKLPSFGWGLLKVPAIAVDSRVACDHVVLGTKLLEPPKTLREGLHGMTRKRHRGKVVGVFPGQGLSPLIQV